MTKSNETEHVGYILGPKLNKIHMEDPWKWLAAGWRDFGKNMRSSMAYGAAFSIITAFILWGMAQDGQVALFLIFASGFMLIAPIFAVGLYEASRRIGRGESPTLKNMMFVKTKSPLQLAYLGLLLCTMFLLWVRAATLVYAIFFGTADFPPIDEVIPMILNSSTGAWMLAVGTIIGASFAIVAFTVSAISIPMMMTRDTDIITALVTSVRAVLNNIKPMMLWAWIIMLFTTFGITTLGLAMLVVYPLIGHATWHAYRAIVPREE